MTSSVHKVTCVKCGTVTDHVELTQRTFAKFPRRNGGQQEIEVKALLMCLICWEKRDIEVNTS